MRDSYSSKKSRHKTDIYNTILKMLNLGTEENTVNLAWEIQKSFHMGDNI